VSVAAVVVAAGSGSRLGHDRPKAFVELAGRPLLEWSIALLQARPEVSQLVVVAPEAECGQLRQRWPAPVITVPGGDERSDSVRRGLAAVSAEAEWVLVHDAARPLVPEHVLTAVIGALRAGAPAVVPVLPVVDTVKLVAADGTIRSTVDRDSLRRVQTPQGFRRDVIVAAYAAAPGVTHTDDAGIVESYGAVPVSTVPGAEEAFKITTPHDLRLAELLAGPRLAGLPADDGWTGA